MLRKDLDCTYIACNTENELHQSRQRKNIGNMSMTDVVLATVTGTCNTHDAAAGWTNSSDEWVVAVVLLLSLEISSRHYLHASR